MPKKSKPIETDISLSIHEVDFLEELSAKEAEQIQGGQIFQFRRVLSASEGGGGLANWTQIIRFF